MNNTLTPDSCFIEEGLCERGTYQLYKVGADWRAYNGELLPEIEIAVWNPRWEKDWDAEGHSYLELQWNDQTYGVEGESLSVEDYDNYVDALEEIMQYYVQR